MVSSSVEKVPPTAVGMSATGVTTIGCTIVSVLVGPPASVVVTLMVSAMSVASCSGGTIVMDANSARMALSLPPI